MAISVSSSGTTTSRIAVRVDVVELCSDSCFLLLWGGVGNMIEAGVTLVAYANNQSLLHYYLWLSTSRIAASRDLPLLSSSSLVLYSASRPQQSPTFFFFLLQSSDLLHDLSSPLLHDLSISTINLTKVEVDSTRSTRDKMSRAVFREALSRKKR
ncbi:hypothetical protein H5410_032183 [Solanum commersonii]|uniref:Uncharacterized protein n=1 Tax=Solanum commersonii TaxID=4109 RepID=A0A9J5YLE5_SOLCO|nr:hypothetical protein H5410_032183 [Solanum commersonii]